MLFIDYFTKSDNRVVVDILVVYSPDCVAD